jgi:hypothetical protein
MNVRFDNPTRTLFPERVAYSNGMLLDDADFEVEQAYHRGRLALLTRYLHGTGTICGLEVEIDTVEHPMVVIAPGLGVDRVGRVMESPLPLCLRIDRWFEDRTEENPSELEQSFTTGGGGTPDHVVADVFLGFRECEVAKRPSFQHGDFDALGAVAPLRLRDAVQASLVIRTEDSPPLPDSNVRSIPGATFAARLANLNDHKRQNGWVEDLWWDGIDGGISEGPEHPDNREELFADIFLARVQIPATAGTPPELNTAITPIVASDGRQMVYSTADLIALGL